MPVMPRSVLLARSRALRTASSQLCGEAPMTCVMRATAMISSVQDEGDLHVDPILDDQPALDLDPLAEHLEPVMPRSVRAARTIPSSTASRKPSGDDAMISVTRATAIRPSP